MANVLLIDDSLLQLTVANSFLAGSGFTVVGKARTAEEGIAQFSAAKPDVVVLDIVMPGQTGTETLRQILALDAQARVVMASSLGNERDVEECLRLGAAGFLQKPFSKEALLATLARVHRGEGGVP